MPYRDTSHPPISIWELREAKRQIKADGRRHIDERAIFDAYGRMREIEQNAQAKTVAVRRAAQRRKFAQEAIRPKIANALDKSESEPISASTPAPVEILTIQPFDEMDDLT